MNEVTEQQAVYVLNRRPYQESSLLVDVFSLNYGRFSIVAKGAMRKGRGWSASLQPFRPLLMSWSGRSSLKTLRSVDTPGEPFQLSSHYLFSGYYLNELIIKLLPEYEANEVIFACYVSSLARLHDCEDLQKILRTFEYVLLQELGMLPDFTNDVDGNEIAYERVYLLSYQEGFSPISHITDDNNYLLCNGKTIGLLRELTGESSEAWSQSDYHQTKSLMRGLVDQALGGEKIKSRELFKPFKYKG